MPSKSAKARVATPAAPAGKKTAQVIQHPLSRVGDNLVNLVTGMGTGKDKGVATQFAFTQLDKMQAEAAYRGDWMSRKVIDIPAYDATREWRTWQADTTDISTISDLEETLGIQRKTMSALQKARLYGGAALVLGVNQGKPEDPLDMDKLGKDCLQFVHVVNRYEITAGAIDWDIMSPYFGTPKEYIRQVQGQPGVTLHPSRIIRFVGAEIPDVNQSQGWGDSILQIVADAVIATGTVFQSMTSLVQEAKVDIVKIPELSERISSKEYEDKLKTRFAMAAVMKSIYSVLMIDKEEEWTRVNQVFTGMPEVMQEFLQMICGAADIPATRFLGQAPKGLSATGESDTRNYYDRVSTEQRIQIQPAISPLDTILQISAFGKAPEGMHYNWNPLWQMTDAEKADIAFKKSQVMTADATAALLDPMVLQKARENQLIEDGTYPGIEQIIEEYGTDINERMPDPNAAQPMIDPNTGKPPDPNDPAAMARAVPDPNAPPPAKNNVVPIGSAKKKGPKGTVPPAKKTATGDEADAILAMATRIRDASTPRTLYIRRDVLNWREIAAFYKKVGVANVYGADMHVTICYSKTPVDWLQVGADSWTNQDDQGNLIVRPGGPRVNEQFGKFLVLAFANSDLQYRHCSILERTGGSWDYDDYTPHVSISKDPGAIDPLTLPAFTGEIRLGPEVFEEIKVEGATYDANALATLKAALADTMRAMPAPQVTVVVPPRKTTEQITVRHDERGRVAGVTKTITEE
jgi:uncharacterized protein